MSIVNGNRTLCVCQGTDDGRPMIHCDNCDNWYHFDCVKLDEETAAEIEQYYCDPCSEQTKLKTTFSWEQTDEELTFIPRTVEAPQPPKSRTKNRTNHSTTIAKQEPSPVVPTATPTFAVEESDDEGGDKDDDGEYTGERQLTRIRRGRQNHQVGSDSDRSPSPDARARKRKAHFAPVPAPKRKRTLVAKSPSPLSDPVRKYCYGKLHEVIEPIFLEYRASQDGVEVDDDKAKSLAATYTATLENAVFGQNSEPDKKGKPSAGTKYKERFRMLTYNVGQADRVSLRRGIGTGSISAVKLSEMSSADLANEQLKQDMEKAAQEALHQSILKEQMSLPRAKITHKGEEIIESNNSDQLQVAREEEERERTRTRLRLRTGSILEGPESAAAISSAAGVTNSAFSEKYLMEVDSGTPLSPENNISPNVSTRPAVISPLSPVTPFVPSHVISSPVQETTSPVEENINGPRISSHQSRPSFDFNALWSGGGGFPSSSMDIEGGLDDEDVAMDIEDDQPGEQDFGIFLDGVEEKPSEGVTPLKTTTPPLPPPIGLAALPAVWSGELVMPFDPDPALINTVSVKQVGGRPLGISQAVWSTLFRSNRTVIDGRVPTDRATKYLLTTRLNSNKELIAVVFEPLPNSTKQYQELIDFLIKKDRHGLIFPWGTRPSSSAPGKDMYLVPLRPSQPLPEFIELLDHVQIPKKRDENILIGVFVLYKGKIVVPPPMAVAEKPVLAAPAPQQPQPPLPSAAVSSLLSSFTNNPAVLPAGMPPGMHPIPMPGMMPPPIQTPGLSYPYAQPPPSMPIPPQPAPAPATDVLTDLTSAIKSMTPEQINLIMKGLSMATGNTGALPPAQSAPFIGQAYPPPPLIPNYNPYSAPQQTPPYPPPVRSPDRDVDYSRDRERRSSPPPRGGRIHPRERDADMGRGRGGPRDRRGQDLPQKGPDGGWNRRRAAAPTGYGQNQ